MISLVLAVVTCGLGYALKQKLGRVKILSNDVQALKTELAKFAPINDLASEIEKRKEDLNKVSRALQQVTETLKEYDLRQDLEEAQFYRPRFEFEDIAHYAEALQLIRDAEKELIRQKRAFHSPSGNEVKGDAKGIGKLALTAFNGESDSITTSVTYNNFEQCKDRLRVAFNKINNLIGPSEVVLASEYLDLKIKEMALAYDHRETEEKVRLEQAELKAQMKEEEHARTEAEDAREEAIKEQDRYQVALDAARKEMESKSDAERAEYEAKYKALQAKYDEATAERQRATAMAQITKKGHVYIISNIGSFGENIFKIGLTRREKPLERVKELSDAAVPFAFDVHALIYAEDAPGLEHALHQHFDQKRMNKANARKEFFKVSLADISSACEKMGHKVSVTMMAEAREYRETLAIEDNKKAA